MTSDPQAVRVAVENLDTIEILRRAVERNDAMRHGNGAYQRTNLTMHDTGLLGEVAVAWWLRQHSDSVVAIADSEHHRRTGAGDLAIERPPRIEGAVYETPPITFEVKTSRYTSWKRYGRTLDQAQLRRSTADAYIWCVVSNDWPTEAVLIMGWLPTDVIETSAAGYRTVEHNRPHWRVTSPMRPMETLPAWWASVPSTPF